MDKKPICNYEGSDYQQAFWEKGGREYEDAVEAIAIKRLLPSSGKNLLELGAGAGRNSSRYSGFERIVLVDYSKSQLQQARQSLGISNRFCYVSADIYQLPFVAHVFDAATMIRTLHHLSDARFALNQVRRILQANGIFVLEFANKRNLKAIIRYGLRRQNWNPFTPEPIEFVALNFNFHPATVETWLKLSGFSIERCLTVSHFRLGLLKKCIPLKLLVWMDSIAQLTGNLWQLSPSIFLRCRAGANGTLVENKTTIFFCPACQGAPIPDTPPRLECPNCGREYSVENGIYDFRL
jgi:SAM-dependent methyltransferase